jgi:hypothetical protein
VWWHGVAWVVGGIHCVVMGVFDGEWVFGTARYAVRCGVWNITDRMMRILKCSMNKVKSYATQVLLLKRGKASVVK